MAKMPGMPITGYVDRWSAHSGEELKFFVSSETPSYKVQLVRLIHGDAHPKGPGVKENAVASPVNGEYKGTIQHIYTGSCMLVDKIPAVRALSVAGSIMPTLTRKGPQSFLSLQNEDGDTTSLYIHESGRVFLEHTIAEENTSTHAALADINLVDNQWYRFSFIINQDTQSASLHVKRHAFHPLETEPVQVALNLPIYPKGKEYERLVFGARNCERRDAQYQISDAFNGRLASLALWPRPLTDDEVNSVLEAHGATSKIMASAVAAWDFVKNADTNSVPDTTGNGLHGVTINRPTRLVTGPEFDGSTENPFAEPAQFNAVHFHDDDLSDAGWKESFSLTISDDLKSGIYAAKLTSALGEDYIPFCVTREIGKPSSKVALLVPTLSYQVYANGRLDPSVLPEELVPLRSNQPKSPAATYVDHYGMRSCYDCHNDGSGVAMASMLRPMPITVRPHSTSTFNSSPHQLGADLYITNWLEEKNIEYDVITDHELDREGVKRLLDYNVVLSGSHAEYWTADMLDGLKSYTDEGGRFIYLSGNGLYWVTALSADGTLAEIRRDQGTRSWSAAPGEAYISLSGKRGGLWRHRGRAPQKYVGVGFASQGFDRGRPYKRTDASYTSRAAYLFKGIEDDIIGDFPAFVSAYGAAGYEFDRADTAQGTPEHALVLATASGFSDCYQAVVEDAPAMAPMYGGSSHPDVRADLVFFETPNNGAVFSFSSIAWSSALSYNNYDNNVSKLTENVVRAFMRSGPLPQTK